MIMPNDERAATRQSARKDRAEAGRRGMQANAKEREQVGDPNAATRKARKAQGRGARTRSEDERVARCA